MNHVRQPPNANQCGAACVAMLANVPLEDVVGQIGAVSVRWPQIYQAAFALGVVCDAALEPAFCHDDIGPVALVQLPGGAINHMVVRYGPDIYDPAWEEPYPLWRVQFSFPSPHIVVRFANVHNVPYSPA